MPKYKKRCCKIFQNCYDIGKAVAVAGLGLPLYALCEILVTVNK